MIPARGLCSLTAPTPTFTSALWRRIATRYDTCPNPPRLRSRSRRLFWLSVLTLCCRAVTPRFIQSMPESEGEFGAVAPREQWASGATVELRGAGRPLR